MEGRKGERGFKYGGDADDECSRKARKPLMMKDGGRKGERKEGLETRVGWINLLMDELKYGDYTTKINGTSVPVYWNAKTQYCNHIRMI